MAALREEHLAVVRQLQEARREAQRLRRNYANALRRSRALTLAGLSLYQRRQLLRMLRITRGDYEATVTCIDHASHPPPWSALPFEQKVELLRDLATRYTAETVSAVSNPWNPDNRRDLRYLWNLWAEFRVAEWVRDTNQSRGVAPSSARVYEKLLEQAGAAPPKLKRHLLRQRTANAKRKWAGRWRQTWSGKLGTLAVGDVDDPATFQEKALFCIDCARCENLGATKSCRESAKRIWKVHISRSEKRAQIAGTKTTPANI